MTSLECFICGKALTHPGQWQECGRRRGQKLHAHTGECINHYYAEHDRLLDALDVQFGRERAARKFGH